MPLAFVTLLPVLHLPPIYVALRSLIRWHVFFLFNFFYILEKVLPLRRSRVPYLCDLHLHCRSVLFLRIATYPLDPEKSLDCLVSLWALLCSYTICICLLIFLWFCPYKSCRGLAFYSNNVAFHTGQWETVFILLLKTGWNPKKTVFLQFGEQACYC